MFTALAVLVFAACGGNGSGSEGGSTNQCSAIVTQMCERAVACSSGAEVVFVIGADQEAGVNSFDFAVNGGESHCEGLVGLACAGKQPAAFTANCAGASGYPCGPSSAHGSGLMVPASCWDSL
ncbi:MAG: hypothetical protein ACREJ3_01175 [Polyangiaceae bacterium]